MRVCLLLVLLCVPAHASYRVFKLRLRHFDPKGKPIKTEVVTSSLDPNQYEHYHGGYRETKVELVDSWYCPGDTSRKKYCSKPSYPDRYLASGEEKRSPVK